jgi:hypothetical protein
MARSGSYAQRTFGALQVRGGVHVCEWPFTGECDADLHAVLQRAELFEFLYLLESRRRQ